MLSPESKDAIPVTLRVNGEKYDLRIDPRTTLLDCLREHLHLTGSKKGCDHGQCGACTVHINGRRVNSCLCLAAMHEGEEITTVEGIGQPGNLHAVQAAFLAHDHQIRRLWFRQQAMAMDALSARCRGGAAVRQTGQARAQP